MQCLRAIGYHGDRCSIGTFDFMQFRACSQEAVLARRNGLLYIKHSVMKEAVLYFFLSMMDVLCFLKFFSRRLNKNEKPD